MTPEEIKAIRQGLGLSQEKFAERVQVDRVTIVRWESGHQAPRGKYVIRRLEVLAKKTHKR